MFGRSSEGGAAGGWPGQDQLLHLLRVLLLLAGRDVLMGGWAREDRRFFGRRVRVRFNDRLGLSLASVRPHRAVQLAQQVHPVKAHGLGLPLQPHQVPNRGLDVVPVVGAHARRVGQRGAGDLHLLRQPHVRLHEAQHVRQLVPGEACKGIVALKTEFMCTKKGKDHLTQFRCTKTEETPL